MSIGNRILLGFAAVIAVLVALGAYSVERMGSIRDTTEVIISRDFAALKQLVRVRQSQDLMRDARHRVMLRYLLRNLQRDMPGEDPIAAWNRYAALTDTAINEMAAATNRFASTSVSGDRAAAWSQAVQLVAQAAGQLRELRTATEAQFQAIRNDDLNTAFELEGRLVSARAQFDDLTARIEAALDDIITAGQQQVVEVHEQSRFSLILVVLAALALGVAITLAIRRSIVRPLAAFMEFVERVGRGDLAGATAATGRDEIGRLGATLNTMVEGLRQLARQSREATENLNAAAAEIRASTQEQAASVEEQLAAVQETAATVDEITHAGAQIGKRAQEVIASAQATAQTSTAGLRAVDETVRAMDAIREQAEAVAQNIVALSEKTQAIGEIISTVNDISERSHLLALNAAIEAAAAGEHGRSFSVVAAEMKALADQAKEATSQVRSILGDIQRGINTSVMLTEEAVKRVGAGRERTSTTHGTINEITARIQESVQTFQQIVASTNQQQLGIEQVMGALQNIRQASQQTAAGTRQLDTAAANLANLSQQLVVLADRYRL